MTGDKIRELRIKLKMSRRELGDALGVSWRTIEGYEQGRRSPMSAVLKALKTLEAEIMEKK